jgi:hypothetical protein
MAWGLRTLDAISVHKSPFMCLVTTNRRVAFVDYSEHQGRATG